MAQKKAAALQTHEFPDMQSACTTTPDINTIALFIQKSHPTTRLSTLKLAPKQLELKILAVLKMFQYQLWDTILAQCDFLMLN